MKIKAMAISLLSVLLAACTTATPASVPIAAISPTSSPSEILPAILSPAPTAIQTLEPTFTPTAESIPILERVAQVGGGINGITIAGDVAYVGMGARVAAIDISQHEQPQLIGQSGLLPGLVSHLIQVTGGTDPLLLVGAGKYLILVEPSTPEGIKPVFQLELEGAVSSLAWDAQASRAYAGVAYYDQPTHLAGIISSVELNTDYQLKIINSVNMPEYPLSLAVGKDGLFAGAQGELGGLYHIHLDSDGKLSQPHQVIASAEGPGEPLQPLFIQVTGDRLYLTYRDIAGYDINNPDQPMKLWSQRVPGCDIVKGFSVIGDQAFAFGWTILSEFGRGAITLPEPITGAYWGEAASVMAVHNGAFLVANSVLEIYDTADPQDLGMIGKFQTAVVNALDAVVNDQAIYVLDIGDASSITPPVLKVLSLPDLNLLGQVTTELSNWYNIYGFTLEGDRLYIAKEDGVWAFDVGTVEPVPLGKVGISNERVQAIASIGLGEKRLLFAVQKPKGTKFDNELRVYDLTNLQNPTLLGEPLALGEGWSIQMSFNGATLHVLLGYTMYSQPDSSTLYILDYVNNALHLKGTLAIPGSVDHMAAAKNIILLSGSNDQVRHSFVSVLDTQSLQVMSQAALPAEDIGLAILNDKALVVVGYGLDGIQNGFEQLLIYDVHDPAHLTQMEAMDWAASTNYKVPMVVSNSYLVLLNGVGGVEVLRYGQ